MDTTLLSGGADAVYPGVNVDLARDTHLEPDVVWTSDTDESGLGLATTPEVVVEVHRSPDDAPVVLRRGDTLSSEVLPGFAAAVDDLLGPGA